MSSHNEDLLSGALSDREKAPLDKGLQELSLFLKLRQSLFSSAISLSVILYMTAIVIAGAMVYMLNKNSDIHWHASLLVAAFVIPPTVIILALMRGVFKSNTQDQDSTGLPAADLVKDVYKEIFKKGMEAVFKAEKAS